MKIHLSYIILLFTLSLSAQHEPHQNDDGRIIKIPVVFHLVNKKAINKMTYQKAKEIIKQLNNNYGGKNDMSHATPEYKVLAGSPNISFYIADYNIHPNGNKGIIEHKKLYITQRGRGRKSINPSKWLNVFVVSKGTASDMLTDDYNSISLKIDYKIIDDGTSLTHEIGHWLGLWHVWGEGNCGYEPDKFLSDSIADTPPQKTCTDIDRRVGIPSRPNSRNFMDYSANRCVFTKNQSQQMRNNIINYKKSLFDESLNL